MQPTTKKIGSAVASPTKEFFVRMLTRDIELQDALLDLLDNCVDGILRSGKAKKSSTPYKGFKATITLAKDYFSIEDNCGGIPFDVAKKYAFAMGRPKSATGMDAPASVGMYGIGMKRAIFKMGTDAIVESRNDKGFVVEFTPKWMQTDTWEELPMHALRADQLPLGGTRIYIDELRDEAAAAFADDKWIDDFRKTVSRHYSIIIAKGFTVRVGAPDEIDKPASLVPAEDFKLLYGKSSKKNGPAVAPYIYFGRLNGVEIEIYAGIYRRLLSEDEIDDEEQARTTSDDSGWTVACNDRVVIWKDKTRLTGWGEATVPNFHGQFIAITGIVLLRAEDPKKLPLTTTKRGVDAASQLYSEVKDLMREATKSLTSFTNKWKKFPEKLEEIYQTTDYVDLEGLRSLAASLPLKKIRNLDGVHKYEPEYPEPEQQKTSVRVSFAASKPDVAYLARRYFDDPKAKPGAVGEKAFREALKIARQGGR